MCVTRRIAVFSFLLIKSRGYRLHTKLLSVISYSHIFLNKKNFSKKKFMQAT